MYACCVGHIVTAWSRSMCKMYYCIIVKYFVRTLNSLHACLSECGIRPRRMKKYSRRRDTPNSHDSRASDSEANNKPSFADDGPSPTVSDCKTKEAPQHRLTRSFAIRSSGPPQLHKRASSADSATMKDLLRTLQLDIEVLSDSDSPDVGSPESEASPLWPSTPTLLQQPQSKHMLLNVKHQRIAEVCYRLYTHTCTHTCAHKYG